MPPRSTQAAAAANVSPTLLSALVWQESRWNAQALSPKGAMGLAQLMPATARYLGVNPADPVANLNGGARYLRQLLDQFDGNVEKALAAYNAGPGRVRSAGGVPAIAETQNYVVVDRASHSHSAPPGGNSMKFTRGLAALADDCAERSGRCRGADPQGSGPIVAALMWLQGTLLGNVATAVAVIAVAMVGFMMLTGRMNWRFGATVIIGCFILFGAGAIVSGIQSAAAAG